MPELSVCIPARNEEWLNLTVADVFRNSTADTEVIVVLDGAWPRQPLAQHPKLTVVYLPESIGQRAATNLAARISTATYVMKLDAHCSVAHGFDTTLIESAKELGRNVVQVPAQRNLHVYDWVCNACGRREYQRGLTQCHQCASTDIRKEVVWKPRGGTRMIRWRLDSDLHYQGWGGIPAQDYVETMSCLGACWFVGRDYWHEIEGLDEGHGSWGQVGCELACKTWLSGGRMVTNTKTDYAHFFRVGGQQFPYAITGNEQEYARQYSRNLWRGNRWHKQIHPLKWMVDKFWPVPGWTEEQRDALPGQLTLHGGIAGHAAVVDDRAGVVRLARAVPRGTGPTRGLVFYTDNRLDPGIARTVQHTLEALDLPLVAVSLRPLDWPGVQNIVLDRERGYLTMFMQILEGLEALKTDVAFLCEHDVLYHPSHFSFTPVDRHLYYYNANVWKVDAESGRALHYRCNQTSGLCAYRELLVNHYRARVSAVAAKGYSNKMGFEPGTHNRPEKIDDYGHEVYLSDVPNVDIRHGQNLTPSRWSKDEFRNQKYTDGWTESDSVPGWGVTRGRFADFLAEVRHGQLQGAA